MEGKEEEEKETSVTSGNKWLSLAHQFIHGDS